jgi:GNAT superfamily N-acetyltransferase
MVPQVRSATSADAGLIAQLTRDCWRYKPANSSGHHESSDNVIKSLQQGIGFILELESIAIGSVRAYPVYTTTDHGEQIGPIALEIARLGILPEYRGRKLSSWLMNAVTLAALHQGCEELRLAVREDEPELLRFYEQQGFFVDTSFTYSHANPNSPAPITMRKYLYQHHHQGEVL